MTKPSQFLTYQHNVQKYFLGHRDKYAGIIIPLSIATTFPSATYGFIRALCARDKSKRYAIDPRNALFQKSWNRELNVRDPHKKMAAALGEPFLTGITRPLSPSDFATDAVVDEATKNCLGFQKLFRSSTDDERKLKKYMKMLGLESMSALGDPQFLIPPYFQFDEIGDSWCDVSRRTVIASLSHCGKIPVRPVIHFSRWAGIDDWSQWFDLMVDKKIASFWFYPNNFREHDALIGELRRYRESVEEAVKAKLQPSALFAGYFGILLSYFGQEGFGNGVGYGEWRDSGYHKGGTAATRVYVAKLHQFLDAPAAQNVIDIDRDYFGTGTDILESCIASDRPLTTLTLEEGLDHFMECRQAEIEFVGSHPLDDAIGELSTTVAKLRSHTLEYQKYGVPLERWMDSLS